jgi:hypothetical protein
MGRKPSMRKSHPMLFWSLSRLWGSIMGLSSSQCPSAVMIPNCRLGDVWIDSNHKSRCFKAVVHINPASLSVHFHTCVGVSTRPHRRQESSVRCFQRTRTELVPHTPIECLQIQWRLCVFTCHPAAWTASHAIRWKVSSDQSFLAHQNLRIGSNDQESYICCWRFLYILPCGRLTIQLSWGKS